MAWQYSAVLPSLLSAHFLLPNETSIEDFPHGYGAVFSVIPPVMFPGSRDPALDRPLLHPLPRLAVSAWVVSHMHSGSGVAFAGPHRCGLSVFYGAGGRDCGHRGGCRDGGHSNCRSHRPPLDGIRHGLSSTGPERRRLTRQRTRTNSSWKTTRRLTRRQPWDGGRCSTLEVTVSSHQRRVQIAPVGLASVWNVPFDCFLPSPSLSTTFSAHWTDLPVGA